MHLTNKIILGTVQFGLPYGINNQQGIPSEKEVFNILDLAFENNIRLLDTAAAYGVSETRIKEYHKISGTRKFDIISKFKYTEDIDLSALTNATIQLLNITSFYS